MNRTDRIRRYLVDEFLPDVPASDLPDDYDLLEGGVVDSLGVLKVLGWVEKTFHFSADDMNLNPDDFRTVLGIDRFVAAAVARRPEARDEPAGDSGPPRSGGAIASGVRTPNQREVAQ
jgi:acyl carrier protein